MVYKLNPTISDLLDNKLYMLHVYNNVCIVPLWMAENHFDIPGYEVIVFCNPQLPDNIQIDEYNNIHVHSSFDISNTDIKNKILKTEYFQFSISEKVFQIPFSELYLKPFQIYTIKHKSNIIVHIQIV